VEDRGGTVSKFWPFLPAKRFSMQMNIQNVIKFPMILYLQNYFKQEVIIFMKKIQHTNWQDGSIK